MLRDLPNEDQIRPYLDMQSYRHIKPRESASSKVPSVSSSSSSEDEEALILNVGGAGHRRRYNSTRPGELPNSSQKISGNGMYSNGSVHDSETTITPHKIHGMRLNQTSSRTQPINSSGPLVLPKHLDQKKATTETSGLTDIVGFHGNNSHDKNENNGKVLYSRDLLKDALSSTNAGRRRSIPSNRIRGRKDTSVATTNYVAENEHARSCLLYTSRCV